MSALRRGERAALIAFSDVHLSHDPPAARKAEKDWYAAQSRILKQVREIQKLHKGSKVIIPGDIFHTWKEPAECIAFALRELPDECWCIGGNHDFPYHKYELRHRSAYGVLVAAGKVEELYLKKETVLQHHGGNSCVVYGFPYGFPAHPVGKEFLTDDVLVCVAHQFIWNKSTGFPGAPESGNIKSFRSQVQGYHAALVGDNHKRFLSKPKEGEKGCTVLNCGFGIPRAVDEKDRKPAVGLIYPNGRLEVQELDTTGDAWSDPREVAEAVAEKLDLTKFTKGLKELTANPFDFAQAVREWIRKNDVPEVVRNMLLRCLEVKC